MRSLMVAISACASAWTLCRPIGRVTFQSSLRPRSNHEAPDGAAIYASNDFPSWNPVPAMPAPTPVHYQGVILSGQYILGEVVRGVSGGAKMQPLCGSFSFRLFLPTLLSGSPLVSSPSGRPTAPVVTNWYTNPVRAALTLTRYFRPPN